MDVVAKADQLARQGKKIYHLEVGQPQSSAPKAAISIAQEQLGSDRCGYTAARGEPPLRAALVEMYRSTYGVSVSPDRIHLTPGSSGAFTIAFMAAFDVGDAVAVPASCYPCYRNLLQCYGCELVTLPVDANYNVTAVELAAGQAARAASGQSPIKGLILSSPANPTGAMLSPDELKGLCKLCDATGVQFISDEIYHGIVYSGAPRAACALEFSRRPIVINSFSKYYSMTGWRLGGLIVPEHLDACVDALNQNMNVSAPTVAQRAAVSALSASARPELEEHVRRYEANRQVVIEGLGRMGVSSSEYAPPQGAFYLYADLRAHGVRDSLAFCDALLEEAGVALTPGVDFEEPGSGLGEGRVRIGFPGATEDVAAAMAVLGDWWTSPTALRLRGLSAAE
uniref:Aminotransferase class I/classII large domain-containing protein n=1 Tax=Pyrodinium bahamense TaxID=73915 RepID=A0A7S0A9P8_9DINO